MNGCLPWVADQSEWQRRRTERQPQANIYFSKGGSRGRQAGSGMRSSMSMLDTGEGSKYLQAGSLQPGARQPWEQFVAVYVRIESPKGNEQGAGWIANTG